MSREAGQPWHDKMLPLPGFLLDGAGRAADPATVESAFRLTGFFFDRHVYEPRGIVAPEARAGFLAAIAKHRAVIQRGESAA